MLTNVGMFNSYIFIPYACRQVKIIVPDIHEMVKVSLQYNKHLSVDLQADMFPLNTPCL